MSKDGCWRCGSLLHHRKACDADVTEDSAVLTKKEAMSDQRHGKGKSLADKQKWIQKQNIHRQPILPRQFLRKHIDEMLQLMQEIGIEMESIGQPELGKATTQLNELTLVQSKLKEKMETMREIVSHSKNYVHNSRASDNEDYIFKCTLEELDSQRQPLWTRLCRMISAIKDVQGLEIELRTNLELTKAELEESESIFGERSPTADELEGVTCKLRDIKPLLKEESLQIAALKKLCDVAEFETELGRLNTLFDRLWNTRAETVKENMEQASCKICMTNDKELALLCGHQLCQQCYNSINTSAHRRCPFCEGGLRNPRRLYQN